MKATLARMRGRSLYRTQAIAAGHDDPLGASPASARARSRSRARRNPRANRRSEWRISPRRSKRRVGSVQKVARHPHPDGPVVGERPFGDVWDPVEAPAVARSSNRCGGSDSAITVSIQPPPAWRNRARPRPPPPPAARAGADTPSARWSMNAGRTARSRRSSKTCSRGASIEIVADTGRMRARFYPRRHGQKCRTCG